jgi:hypothetical protein
MLPSRKKRYKTFLSDTDGLSAKDYLLLISTGVFFLFVGIGLVLVLFDKEIDDMYLSLLDMVVPVVMTVVGGVMGVQAVEIFRKKKEPKQEEFPYREDEF